MTSPAPLPPDDVDLLLSAELDDDFDAAAADLGLRPDDARARLASTPGVDARRTAFATAHELSRTPEELPPSVRDRLVSMTRPQPLDTPVVDDLSARRSSGAAASPWTRRLVGAGAVAAALALVVGVFASLAGDSGDADDSADGVGAEALSDELRSYGDVSDESRIRALLDSDRSDGSADSGDVEDDATGGAEGAPVAPRTAPPEALMFRTQVSDCVTTLADELAGGTAALEQGTARFAGAPAGLVVFDLDGRRFAVVFDPDTCEPRKTVLGPP